MKELSFFLSEIQIKYNPKISPLDRPKILSSNDAYIQFMFLFDRETICVKEEAAVIFLNRGNRVIGGYKLSSGGITGTIVDIRIILGIALKSLATGIIIAHTHPSGELKPSKSDIDLTEQLKQACKLMEITLFDHLIITEDSYFSFEDERIL
jgi:DNA repair protein RadC